MNDDSIANTYALSCVICVTDRPEKKKKKKKGEQFYLSRCVCRRVVTDVWSGVNKGVFSAALVFTDC